MIVHNITKIPKYKWQVIFWFAKLVYCAEIKSKIINQTKLFFSILDKMTWKHKNVLVSLFHSRKIF